MWNQLKVAGRIITACVLTLFLIANSAFASERVQIGDGRVSFIPPAGFKPLTKEQINLKFARGHPPQYVFANETGAVSVAITFSPARMAPEQLAEYGDAMEQMLPRMIPGMELINREFVTIDGRKWLHLEFESNAIDTDIHNHMYMTSFSGKALIFGFNSTIKDYPEVKDKLLESAKTIRLRD